MVKNLTTEEFKELVFDYTQEDKQEWLFKGEKPAIVDYFASWCVPCKTIAPILEELSTEYDDIDFYKVDTEAQPEVAAAFGIQSIPSILFIPMEGQPQMAMGALPKETFKQAIAEILFGEKNDKSEPEETVEKTDEKE